jgi:hypothetical protein
MEGNRMSQDQATSTVCTAAETEDWLAMELAEQNACRSAAILWCITHARPILSLATIGVCSLIAAAMAFG